MERYSLASLGITAVLLSLYIFSYAKKLKTLVKITSFLLMPFSGAYAVLLLFDKLPDSMNIMTATFFSYIAATFCVILFYFEKNKFLRLLAILFFTASQICWTNIYFSSFFMYKLPTYALVLAIIFYAGLVISIFILIKKKTLFNFITSAAVLALTTLFAFCALITLCFGKQLYSIALLGAAILTEFVTVYYILQTERFEFKHGDFIRLIIFLISQTLTATSGIIMFYTL